MVVADVSPLTAAVIIIVVFASIAALFLYGMRVRLELEIPPRRAPEAAPVTRAFWVLFGVQMGSMVLVGFAAVAQIRWLVFGAFGVYAAALVARIVVRVRQVRKAGAGTRPSATTGRSAG